jgi:hypothetical protein
VGEVAAYARQELVAERKTWTIGGGEMMDLLLNILTWVLIMAGFLLFAGLVGLCFFITLEKMND